MNSKLPKKDSKTHISTALDQLLKEKFWKSCFKPQNRLHAIKYKGRDTNIKGIIWY